MRAEIRDEFLAIDVARLRRAQRVDVEFDALDAEPAPHARGHRNQLGVDVRAREADGLHIDLVELPVAALLRPLAPEHRAHAPELVARTTQHAVGDHRAHDARSRFGSQGEAVFSLVGEGVHFLLDHVGEFADRALEELGVLDDRHPYLFESVLREQVAHGALEMLPGADLRRQHIVHSTDSLYLLCQLNLRRMRGSRGRSVRAR